MSALSSIDTQRPDLASKYEAERQKRLGGVDRQSVPLQKTKFADYAADPFVDYAKARATDATIKSGSSVKAFIVGAGHNGLIFAARLIAAGFKTEEILLVDNAGGWGGVWYWNRYPGLMCDVEGYVYLPLLEETGFVPKHKYSYGEEIRQNAEEIAAKYKLRGLFTTTVTEIVFDGAEKRYTAHMNRKLEPAKEDHLEIKADFVFLAGGFLHVPRIPVMDGLDEYLAGGGKIFHTSRWDFKLTGGTQSNPGMTNLKDKRVGVIGTGATAVQAIPELAKYAKELTIFQRTPSFVGERSQKDTIAEDWEKVTKGQGWQIARQRNFNSFITNDPEPQDLIQDGWTAGRAFAAYFGGKGKYEVVNPENVQDHVAYFFDRDTERTSDIRNRAEREVADKETAQKLQAWYPGWCKRPVFNDDYLPTFNRPNVSLVDTNGRGIDKFNANGIVANGVEYKLDIVVLGTGFDTARDLSPAARAGITVKGRNDKNLQQKWISPDFSTLHGIMTSGFPNLFFTSGLHQGLTFNLTSQYDIAAKHVSFLASQAVDIEKKTGKRTVIEAQPDLEEKWCAQVAVKAMWYATLPICTPGWMTADEKMKPPQTVEEQARAAKKLPYAGGIIDYTEKLKEFRESGEWKKLIRT